MNSFIFGRINSAATLHELADVAVVELERLKSFGDPIVQICGPMSTGGLGNVENNMKLFRYAIDRAIKEGFQVFDQIPFQGAIVRITNWTPDAPYCMDILEVFYRRILESGHVDKTLYLPSWESSWGAVWEYRKCQILKIPAENYPADWLKDFRPETMEPVLVY